MTQVILDRTLRTQLHNLTEPLELCDESGRLLARVVPVLDESQYEPVEPQVSTEELQRRRESTEWYSTAEVLAYLDEL